MGFVDWHKELMLGHTIMNCSCVYDRAFVNVWHDKRSRALDTNNPPMRKLNPIFMKWHHPHRYRNNKPQKNHHPLQVPKYHFHTHHHQIHSRCQATTSDIAQTIWMIQPFDCNHNNFNMTDAMETQWVQCQWSHLVHIYLPTRYWIHRDCNVRHIYYKVLLPATLQTTYTYQRVMP